MPSREAISSVDTAWLRMDRPANLMQIVGVMLFDGELDFSRLRISIERRMLTYGRFRQVVVAEGSAYAWQDDPDFNLDHHLHRETLPGAAGRKELQDYVAELASTPLNRSRPLWDFHLIDTSLGGQALAMRIHHSIADGVALVGVVLSLADEASNAEQAAGLAREKEDGAAHGPDPFWDALWGPMSEVTTSSLLRGATNVWGKYRGAFQHPGRMMGMARIGAAIAGEIAKIALMPDDSQTRFKGWLGTVKRVAWSEQISLSLVKEVGKALGCSVNDLMLSAATGALRAYLLEQGDDIDGVKIRAMVPVNMRRPQDIGQLGNRFGVVVPELPLGIENPLARLYATRERMAQLKHSYQAALTVSVLGLVGMLPKAAQEQVLDLLTRKATTVMTNVPGPTSALHLAGARLREPLFWVPQSGDIGIGVSILSYDGKVQFGLITDKNLVPDPERIAQRFVSEFDKLMLLVLMEPRERLADPDLVESGLDDLVGRRDAAARRDLRARRRRGPVAVNRPAARKSTKGTPPVH